MENTHELSSLPKPEIKERQLLFEVIEKLLKKKQRQVLRDFKAKNKQFIAWTNANHYSLTLAKKSFTKYLFVTGFSTVVVGSALLGNAASPSAVQAQTAPDSAVQIATPSATANTASDSTAKSQTTTVDTYAKLNEAINNYQSWPNEQSESEIGVLVSQLTNIPATATLDGHKMNKIYGYFGKEQHLYRYPGDTLEDHFHNDADRAQFMSSGIAPGLGAWGYFAPSKTQFTAQDAAREKYYIAAQTFLFPGFYSDKSFKDWLKYRKVVVYNPANGRAIVADIADSGPATWTGKSFGGSPAVMAHLQMVDGAQKSQAVVLFVDDPGNKIPLGPIDIQSKGAI